MDNRLTNIEQQLIAVATDFVAAHDDALDATNAVPTFPTALYQAAAAQGLSAIQVPTSHQGKGLGFRCKMRVAEELAKRSMAFSFSLINTHNAAAKLADCASAEFAAQWVPALIACEQFGATALTEPHTGSDFAAIKTHAQRIDNGWRLNGEKAWITNAAFANVFITYAQTDASKGWRGIACFAVDANQAGFTRTPPLKLFGGNAIGAGGFRLDDYLVADAALIHAPGDAFKAALGSINGARTYVAAMCCAMLEDSLARATHYGQQRTAFGKRLLDNQGLRWMLADVATEVEAMRALTYRAAEFVETNDPQAIVAAAHAKKYAARTAEKRILDCIQAMGANGLLVDHQLGEHLACAKIANYADGSSEIQNERIATLLFDGR